MFLGGERHGLDHREYREEEYKESMQNIGFRVGDTFYYNFQILPFPIDKYLPFLTVPISKFFEKVYYSNSIFSPAIITIPIRITASCAIDPNGFTSFFNSGIRSAVAI